MRKKLHEDRQQVLGLIYQAIEQVNQQLPPTGRLEKSEEAVLVGDSGKLDSLGFLNLMVTTEEVLAEEAGVEVSLTTKLLASGEAQPPATVGQLADFIEALAKQRSDD